METKIYMVRIVHCDYVEMLATSAGEAQRFYRQELRDVFGAGADSFWLEVRTVGVSLPSPDCYSED